MLNLPVLMLQGTLDVRHAAQRLAPGSLSKGGSLQALASALLGVPVDKALQCSQWQQRRLSKVGSSRC